MPARSSRPESVLTLLRGVCVCALLVALAGCDFLDEGDRFASQVAAFALNFGKSAETTAVFDYIPQHGTNQNVKVAIGRLKWCPKPPCYDQGAATVFVERGRSGTGYRIAAAASVPVPLEIHKQSGAIHVRMNKVNGVVQLVALE